MLLDDPRNFKKFLRTYKSIDNPFLNKNFDVSGMETFSDGNSLHLFFDIKLVYEWNTLRIVFKKKDRILGVFLFYLTMTNNFAYDPEWKTFFNDKEFIANYEYLLNFLDKDLNELNEFKILYSNTESGLNAFEVGKQLIRYPITEDKDDLYYLDKEEARWEKEKKK